MMTCGADLENFGYTRVRTVSKYNSESAAIELKNGCYRLVKVTWSDNASVGTFDYYHAAFEIDGRWNAEFFDEGGKSIWVHGREETLNYDWEFHPSDIAEATYSSLRAGITISVSDVSLKNVPEGSLCQTVDERCNGVPRHWKSWRIV